MATTFQPGDKVSFINEKQSGIVTRIISADLVAVDIGDGFEIPTPARELVRIANQESKTETATAKKLPQPSGRPASSPLSLLPCTEKGSLVFAAAPDEETSVNTGPVKFLLINNSGKEFVFTCMGSRKKEWYGLNRGVLADQSVTTVAVFSRSELMDITSFMVQGHFFSSDKIENTATIRKEVPVMLPGFQEKLAGPEGVYEFAKLFTIHNTGMIEPDDMRLLKEKFGTKSSATSLSQSGQARKRPEITTDQEPVLITEKVIDLHIEILVPDPSQLSNADMIAVQMKRFHIEMDQALRSHIRNIIFIHGVGNGTLKNNIRQELRGFPGVAFRDGDYFKYGSGATEVIFTGK